MKKIISLFQRNYDGDRLVRNEVVPGAEWVINGEGTATEKVDGTCCLIENGVLYKRYDAKKGKTPPSNFRPAQDPDPLTGHWPGWVPVGDGPEDRWHREAWGVFKGRYKTYKHTCELIGPKVQGNKYRLDRHMLVAHGARILHDAPRTYDELKEYFVFAGIEGIVWHHSDGRMVKIKAKDFGHKW